MVNMPRRSEGWRSVALTAVPRASLLKNWKLTKTWLVGLR
jgi:hypothetical protein